MGIALSLRAAMEERLNALLHSQPTEYWVNSLDCKLSGLSETGLKLKFFVTWIYNFAREFVK